MRLQDLHSLLKPKVLGAKSINDALRAVIESYVNHPVAGASAESDILMVQTGRLEPILNIVDDLDAPGFDPEFSESDYGWLSLERQVLDQDSDDYGRMLCMAVFYKTADFYEKSKAFTRQNASMDSVAPWILGQIKNKKCPMDTHTVQFYLGSCT